MANRNNSNSDENLIRVLTDKKHIFKVIGAVCTYTATTFSIGFYFGHQNEIYQHNSEINSLNLNHFKEIADVREKYREELDKKNEQSVDELKKAVEDLKNQKDGR